MRLGIFVDGKTLFYGLRDKKINFFKFKAWLAEKNDVTYAGYFNCLDNVNTKQSFFGHVFKSGFRIFIRNSIKKFKDDTIAFNLSDIELSLESIMNKDLFDKIIIVSGKSDFLPLVEVLTIQGKLVEIVGFNNNIGNVYSKYNTRFIEGFFESV